MPYNSTYRAGPFQQGPAGQSSESIFADLGSAADRAQGFADAEQLENIRLGTGAALAEAGQLGYNLEDLQTKAPDLFAKYQNDPNVDMAMFSDALRLQTTTADSLLTGASNRDKVADDILTGGVTRSLRTQQTATSKTAQELAEEELRNLQAERVEEKRRTDGFAALNSELAPGGALDQQVDELWAKQIEERKYTETEQNQLLANGHLAGMREDLMADPGYVRGLASRNNVTPLEMQMGTLFGKNNQTAQDAMITAQAEVAAIQTKADNLKLENTRLAAGGNNKKIQYNPETQDYEFGESFSSVDTTQARNQADTMGFTMLDDDTKAVVDYIQNKFPDSSAFEATLRSFREKYPDGKLPLGVKKEVDALSKHLQQRAANDVKVATEHQASGSATDTGWEYIKAQRALAQRPPEAGAVTEEPVDSNRLFDITDDAQVSEAIEQNFGPEPAPAALEDQQAYYENAADVIEQELASFSPSAISRSGGAQRSLQKWMNLLRTGYKNETRIGSPATFAKRKATLEKAMKEIRTLRGVENFQANLGNTPDGGNSKAERDFLKKLNQ